MALKDIFGFNKNLAENGKMFSLKYDPATGDEVKVKLLYKSSKRLIDKDNVDLQAIQYTIFKKWQKAKSLGQNAEKITDKKQKAKNLRQMEDTVKEIKLLEADFVIDYILIDWDGVLDENNVEYDLNNKELIKTLIREDVDDLSSLSANPMYELIATCKAISDDSDNFKMDDGKAKQIELEGDQVWINDIENSIPDEVKAKYNDLDEELKDSKKKLKT